MHVLVVGGGSAGHVIPAIPVIHKLLALDMQVSFVGTTSGLEERLVAELPVTYHAVAAGKLRRYWSWQNFTDIFRILQGIVQAFVLLLGRRPDAIFSKGGFVSFPVVFAGWMLRIPVLAHESDLSPGLANKLVMPFTQTLALSFAETQVPQRFAQKLRIVHAGTPIREDMLSGDPAKGRQILMQFLPAVAHSSKRLLVVTGGSLGAVFLNDVVRQALPQLLDEFDVLHVCGTGKCVEMDVPGYSQVEYISSGWGDILAAADIVLSRAGANALFELLALGKLNLLVPLPGIASRGDQLENADFAQKAGLSLVCHEADLDADSLVAALQKLTQNQQIYVAKLKTFVAPDAAQTITDELLMLMKSGE